MTDIEHQPAPPPFRVPSISIWGILVFLVRDFGFYLIVATILGALAGGALLGIAGVLLASQLTDAWVSGPSIFSRVSGYLLYAVITLIYLAGGIVQGFLISVISFILRQTDTIEKELHEFLEPMSQNLVARVPFGQEGIRVEAFAEVFDPVLDGLHVESRPKRFSVFFLGNALMRFALRLVVRAIRWGVDEFFVEELKEEGVTRVNMTQMEKFMRETLTEVVLDRYTRQLKVVRRLMFLITTTLVIVTLTVSSGLLLG